MSDTNQNDVRDAEEAAAANTFRNRIITALGAVVLLFMLGLLAYQANEGTEYIMTDRTYWTLIFLIAVLLQLDAILELIPWGPR